MLGRPVLAPLQNARQDNSTKLIVDLLVLVMTRLGFEPQTYHKRDGRSYHSVTGIVWYVDRTMLTMILRFCHSYVGAKGQQRQTHHKRMYFIDLENNHIPNNNDINNGTTNNNKDNDSNNKNDSNNNKQKQKIIQSNNKDRNVEINPFRGKTLN